MREKTERLTTGGKVRKLPKPPAGVHWTQTEEGKKHMAKVLRKAYKEGRRGKVGRPRKYKKMMAKGASLNGNAPSTTEENVISFAFGHTQAWLESYAQSFGLSSADVVHRVSELLYRASRRTLVGLEHRVSRVRGEATE
jgi:hypothetical protein